MLAALGLLGLGSLMQSVAPDGSEEAVRRELDHIEHNSDDPFLYSYGQLNPVQYRMLAMDSVRRPEMPYLHGWVEHNIKSQQLEILDTVLRSENSLDPDDLKALHNLRRENDFADLPFTGSNMSNDNYRLRYARTLPKNLAEGVSELFVSSATLEDTCGTAVQNDALGGPGQEEQYAFGMGFNECRTGRRMPYGVDQPWFSHMPVYK